MKTLAQLFASEDLKPYLDKANTLVKLNAIFRIALRELSGQCEIANFEKGELILQVQNAAWATRIRYAIPEIIKTLSGYSEFGLLKTIRYKVLAASAVNPPDPENKLISSLAHEYLSEVANDITHPGLKAALTKLATTLESERN